MVSHVIVNGEKVAVQADCNPPKKKAHVHHAYFTATMLFVNTIIFAVTIYVYHKESGRIFEPFPSANPNLGPDGSVLKRMGARDTPLIVNEKQWWRLFTSMFLHAGLIHLVFNMVTLWAIGAPLERSFGTIGIMLIYIVAGFAGNFASAIFLPDQITVGASGAIYGLMGAFWGEFLQNFESYKGRRLRTMATLVIVTAGSLVIGLMPYADNFAHFGGFIGGVLSGLVLLAEKQSKGVGQAIRDAADVYRRAQYSYHGRETFDELVDACHLFKTALHRECNGQKSRLQVIFDKHKKPSRSALTPQGLNQMLDELGVALDAKTRQHLGFEMDKDKDRMISWEEFVGFIALDDATPDVVMHDIESGEIQKRENQPCCSRDCMTAARQYVVGLLAALMLVAYLFALILSLFYVNESSDEHVTNWCTWCEHINCVETTWWDCQ